mgnify:CR=1 FL=1
MRQRDRQIMIADLPPSQQALARSLVVPTARRAVRRILDEEASRYVFEELMERLASGVPPGSPR